MSRLDPFALPLSGTCLIEANAGTGKTHTIASLYLRLLLEAETEVDRILVVTYTNAATAELRTRIRKRLLEVRNAIATGTKADRKDDALNAWALARHRAESRPADLRRISLALHDFDNAAIFTIHGFCQRALQENAFESGVPFDVELISDQTALLDRVVRDFLVRNLVDAEDHVLEEIGGKATVDRLMKLARKLTQHDGASLLPDEPPDAALVRLLLDFARHVSPELQRHKQAANVQFFDDLLRRFARGLAGDGGAHFADRVAHRFHAALIDEFQDTDSLQYEIFQRVFHGRRPLFLIGDPKQAIYGFRGADVFAYLRARDHSGGSLQRLDVNWRSDPDLIRAVNLVFADEKRPFAVDRITFTPADPCPDATAQLTGPRNTALQFLFCAVDGRSKKALGKEATERLVSQRIAEDILRFLNEQHRIGDRLVLPSDIAVLCRTNRQAARVQEQLQRLGIPCVLQGDRSVFDTDEAEDVERVVAAMADPGDAGRLRTALATPLFGLSAAELVELQEHESVWDDWVSRFHSWHGTWLAQGFTPAFRQMLDEGEVTRRLLELPDGERRLTNVLHLGELLQTAAAETRRRPIALADWMSMMRQDKGRGEVGDTAQIRLESDKEALVATTAHRSKGLEFPIVYVPFAWSDMEPRKGDGAVLFHDAARADRLTIDLGSKDQDSHLEVARAEALAENLRLAYVALTRAKHRCCVVWGRFKEVEKSALAYLLHQPAGAKDRPEAIKAHVKKMAPEHVRADLERLAGRSAGAIAVDDLPDEDPSPQSVWRSQETQTPLAARTFTRQSVPAVLRTTSFSGLTRTAHEVAPAHDETPDHDEQAVEDGQPSPRSDEADARVVLADFPRGARLGTMIHHVFEHLDFRNRDPAHLKSTIADSARRFAIVADLDALEAGLREVLDTPFGAAGESIRLADVDRSRRFDELEFLLTAGADRAGHEPFAVEKLAECFARHAAPGAAPAYAERLRALRFTPLEGFLNGFIDLVFRQRVGGRDRWFLADYKSNHLGDFASDYRPERLARVMADEHYFLQYHLYVVALHRYLRCRVAGYEYDRDFGGVFYFFLRGMSPRHAPGSGVFTDRPHGALIEELSALLGEVPFVVGSSTW